MKRILKKSLILILIFCIFIGLFQTMSNATGSSHSDQLMSFIKENHTDSTGAAEKVNKMSATVITAIRIAATCVAIVMLLVLAMKYMIAAPGEKADIKKSAIPYVIGAVVLFGAVGILGIIEKFSTAVKA